MQTFRFVPKQVIGCLGILLALYSPLAIRAQEAAYQADICIYGGTSAGVIAAYTAAKAGKSVLLVEPGMRLGGMSSGGLGQTDIGNKYVVKGLALDFYRQLGQHYGKLEQWIFEPRVADSLFKSYIARCGARVLYGQQLAAVRKEGAEIQAIELQSALTSSARRPMVSAKVFIDCSYEGDLMAKAGASYTVGREDNTQYGETINGFQLMQGHQFPDGVDPYVVPGDSTSGLLWGISDHKPEPNGTGDKKVQAYNYRITLTNVPENRIPIEKPANYDPKKYELLKRWKEKYPWKTLQDVFIWSRMPNGKTDINNRNGFSTDMIGMNWDYPEANYQKRKEIIQAHEAYTKGLLYFVGHDPSVPESIRNEMLQWGYPKDEYPDNNHWSPQLYIREARRLIGELVMTQNHCQGREVVQDDIAYAAYTMDSHNCDRLVVNGMVKNEGNVEVGGFPPFPISYRAIIPKKEEVSNLLVPVCLSASHIAYGSIRMEPVFMVLGQSAAVAARLAIDQHKAVQQISAAQIKTILAQNPKGDGRPADVWIDSRDATVQYTGSWEAAKKGGYGSAFNVAANPQQLSTARFLATTVKKGRYAVYSYYPKLSGESANTSFTLFDGKQAYTKNIDLKAVKIEGQTSGEWLPLGKLEVKADGKSYVEINNKGADGIVAANSILFVPEE
ncbi:FAD-dependent oxidoreductase [Olivibacter ginsenosidimutans]|uniref:FAD-dependent oxidoreductase n=1 Tax=Olivibacter ginsenosidimutans TaxID=1176537 RepID=A0ABP9ATV4_9SPHI